VSGTDSQIARRNFGTSARLPIVMGASETWDLLLSIGGNANWGVGPILDSVQLTGALLAAPAWANGPSLNHKRWLANAVLLPEGRVLVIGGEKENWKNTFSCSEVPALAPEIYDFQQLAIVWKEMKAGTIIRNYHSIALLLPDGRVLTGGGEWRHELATGIGGCATIPPLSCNPPNCDPDVLPADYQIFQPDYISCGPVRPVIVALGGTGPSGDTYDYGGTYDVTYSVPMGAWVSKVMLLSPGSVTHHSDGNQRCVQLSTKLKADNKVEITLPALADNILPRGWYMMFAISSVNISTQGVPSSAAWVYVK
jgi:hypothetical protein